MRLMTAGRTGSSMRLMYPGVWEVYPGYTPPGYEGCT